MALVKTIEEDRIEVVGKFKLVQIHTATVIKEDDVEISRTFKRHVRTPNDDISGESAEVQGICNTMWTDELKAEYQAFRDKEDAKISSHHHPVSEE